MVDAIKALLESTEQRIEVKEGELETLSTQRDSKDEYMFTGGGIEELKIKRMQLINILIKETT